MFVKKLIDKVSKKPISGHRKGLGPEDVNPRLVFHYGVPAGAKSLAYDRAHKILAVSTIDGRIKLYGSGSTQHLLESDEAVPSKFLQFLESQGVLLNVTTENRIQVWNIQKKHLCHVHIYQHEITSFTVLQESSYVFIGDHMGNISVMMLEMEVCHIAKMQYYIPFIECHGTRTKFADVTTTKFMLPQPKAETRRLLIVFEDGTISLWGLQESKLLFMTGGTTSPVMRIEERKVLSSCWACSFGSKVAIGYSNGEVLIWSIPKAPDMETSLTTGQKESISIHDVPHMKLNLGYRREKVPIISLKWISMDSNSSRLYVVGASDIVSSNSCQVVLLSDNTESRITKLILPLSHACQDVEIISGCERNKNRHNILVLLLKSGQLCIYDDSEIEKYLLRCQTKTPLQLPDPVNVKIPFGGSTITVAKFVRGDSGPSYFADEDCKSLTSKIPCLISIDTRDFTALASARFPGFEKVNNLYITGHQDGSVYFWDVSCPLLLPIFSIKHKSEDNHSLRVIPVKALYFDLSSQILVAGYQSGLVHIFTFQPEKSATENIFTSLQAKHGSNYTTHTVILSGAIHSISMNSSSRHLAIGTDDGLVAILDIEGTTILYQKQFSSEVHPRIISMLFRKIGLNGSEKNVLLIALEDSSVLALEEDTGLVLSTNAISPKNPARALFMQILDVEDAMQSQPLLLLCSDKSIRLYSLPHAIQGVKKLYSKKKLYGTCCWASTFCIPCSVYGLVLMFANGKIEIRSIPELNLLKETSLRGLPISNPLSNPKLDGVLSSSSDGELILVNGVQEIFFYSILVREDVYRLLQPISQLLRDVTSTQASSPMATCDKEKKTGLFGGVIKDMKGSKAKRKEGTETLDSVANAAELSAIFSRCNFSLDLKKRNSWTEDGEDAELDIDDIDLEDPQEKPKGKNIAMLNKQVGKKFNVIKGKLKAKTTKDSETLVNIPDKDEKSTTTVNEIKKRYGYSVSHEQKVPNLAVDKLHENLNKLQGINMRTDEMQNSARSYSSMAKELLHTMEQGKRDS